MNEERQAILDALNAERYGKSLWWKAPPKEHRLPRNIDEPEWDNSEATCARRRRELAESVPDEMPDEEAV